MSRSSGPARRKPDWVSTVSIPGLWTPRSPVETVDTQIAGYVVARRWNPEVPNRVKTMAKAISAP
jgi:hypothetical protein